MSRKRPPEALYDGNVAQMKPTKRAARMIMGDSMENVASGLNTLKDPRQASRFVMRQINELELESMYRGDWAAKKVVDIPAMDATRNWRAWTAEDEEIAQITQLERKLRLQYKTRLAKQWARLYGGSAMIIGCLAGGLETELKVEAVTPDSFVWLHVVSQHEISPVQGAAQITDAGSLYYGMFEAYQLASETAGSKAMGTKIGRRSYIHPSRLVRFVGTELPPRAAGSIRGTLTGCDWGDSCLLPLYDAVMALAEVSNTVASMVGDAKLDVIKVPDLTESLVSQEYKSRLIKRFEIANYMKSTVNTLLLDADEEWERIVTQFNALPDVIKAFMVQVSGAADIPATRFLSQAPQGMNATGDSDTRNYYDRLSGEQENEYRPAMEHMDKCLVASAIGKYDEDSTIDYVWRSIWQTNDIEKADLATKRAAMMKADVDSGLVPIEVLEMVRRNQVIEDDVYPGAEDAFAKYDLIPEGEREEDQLDPIEAMKAMASIGAGPPANDDDEEGGVPIPGKKKKPVLKVVGKDGKSRVVTDAKPIPLYVYRPLTNKKDIAKWAKAQGFTSVIPDLHVTILYSKAAVDPIKMGTDYGNNGPGSSGDGPITLTGGPRALSKFGEGAVVLEFSAAQFGWRHQEMVHKGASHDWNEYHPHVTITYEAPPGLDISKVEPYRGPLKFGMEVFEEIDADPSWEKAGERVLDNSDDAPAKTTDTASIAKAIADALREAPIQVKAPRKGKEVTKVTKHDAAGRILEFERREVPEDGDN